ncbi:MAG: sigma 54-dependent Fis family transcriptional regulator [Myxococcaceae bacterium]|nr:sigma 54-dependent Fis family transcriptional regulator [Myxococcaceae bacterium]
MPSDSTAPLPADALNRDEERTFDPTALRYQLEVLSGSKLGTCVTVDGPLVLGSGDDAGLQLADATVSRRHASLEPSPQGVWVKDLGSKNGTFLAGTRVDGFVVRREATFALGTTLLRLSGVPRSQTAGERTSFGEALGQSSGMRALFSQLATAAPTMSNVLLGGETGTGKEVLARALHEASPRKHRPFVVVDCGALSGSLIESELFGHAKGAFTGAQAARDGAFTSANGGTVFLDEIGELALELQPRLLRVLESRTVRRVGEDVPRNVDVRVVAATHRDLAAEVKAGRFREDLYFRLAVVVARVPPLRERLDDVPLITHAMLARLGRPDFELSPSLLARLKQHDWPGNVRELRNVIERAVSGGNVSLDEKTPAAASTSSLPYKQAKEQLVEDFTREYFTRLFEQCGGNVAELARTAGIARTYAHEVIKKYGLKG